MPRHAYRRHLLRFVFAYLFALPAAYFWIFALGLGPGPQAGTTGRIVMAILGAPFAVLAVRSFRVGVFTRPDGVVVRNVLRSYRIRWEDVDAFVLGDWGGFPIGAVRRRDGTEQRAIALNPPRGTGDAPLRGVQRMLDALNEDLARVRR